MKNDLRLAPTIKVRRYLSCIYHHILCKEVRICGLDHCGPCCCCCPACVPVV